jgi:hypothetical protein
MGEGRNQPHCHLTVPRYDWRTMIWKQTKRAARLGVLLAAGLALVPDYYR